LATSVSESTFDKVLDLRGLNYYSGIVILEVPLHTHTRPVTKLCKNMSRALGAVVYGAQPAADWMEHLDVQACGIE